MKSDVIQIDNMENGFLEAREQAVKSAVFRGLDRQSLLHLQLLTEEMLSMVHSVAGKIEALFWVESEGRKFELHLTTQIIMDRETRQMLIDLSSAQRNEAANSFLGRLRNAFEEAMVSDSERVFYEMPADVQADLIGREYQDPDWDGYEGSVLRKMADEVKIYIRGNQVHLHVARTFA